MKEIIFDYKIDLQTIGNDKKNQIESFDIDWLKDISDGRIFILFNSGKRRTFIMLETSIIDYILQFDGLIGDIDNGIYETYTVSSDYYSNSLRYKYNPGLDNLSIIEVNGGDFEIDCSYKFFKSGYQTFRKKVISELIIYYPELKNNVAFKNLINNHY